MPTELTEPVEHLPSNILPKIGLNGAKTQASPLEKTILRRLVTLEIEE